MLTLTHPPESYKLAGHVLVWGEHEAVIDSQREVKPSHEGAWVPAWVYVSDKQASDYLPATTNGQEELDQSRSGAPAGA